MVLYKQIVCPSLTYASTIQYTSKQIIQKNIENFF